MKRFTVAILASLMVLGLSSCKCTAAKYSVSQIEATHDLMSQMLIEYIATDPKLDENAPNITPDDRINRKKEKVRRQTLIFTDQENIAKLKKALED